jgi:hypothetical protein
MQWRPRKTMNAVVIEEVDTLDDSDKLTRNNLIKVVREEGIPRCFDTRKQYNDWLEQEKSAATEPFRRNICEDCVRSFKMLMCSQNRCVNRHQKVADDPVDM